MSSSTSSVAQLGILSVCETVLCVAQGPVPVHPQLPEVLDRTCRSRYDSKLCVHHNRKFVKRYFFFTAYQKCLSPICDYIARHTCFFFMTRHSGYCSISLNFKI